VRIFTGEEGVGSGVKSVFEEASTVNLEREEETRGFKLKIGDEFWSGVQNLPRRPAREEAQNVRGPS
jgi:hypothetical protein